MEAVNLSEHPICMYTYTTTDAFGVQSKREAVTEAESLTAVTRIGRIVAVRA